VHGEPVAVAGRSIQVSLRTGACTSRSQGVEIMEDLFLVAESALTDARAQDLALVVSDEGAA
jgi:hypothetical protein